MAYILLDYFQKNGLKVLENSLRRLEGRPVSRVNTAPEYRKNVVQRAWFELLLPVRMMGRKHLKWDELYAALRDEALDLRGPHVLIKPSLTARITQLVKRFYGPQADAAAVA